MTTEEFHVYLERIESGFDRLWHIALRVLVILLMVVAIVYLVRHT